MKYKKDFKPGELFNQHKEMAMKRKNWIANAIKKPGALHAQLGVKQGAKIPGKKLAAAAKKGGKEGKRARLAQTLASFHHKKGKKKSGLRPASVVVKSEQNASHQMYKRGKKKMTLAQDRAYDKKHGLKEGSKADIAQDKREGIKDKKRKAMKGKCKLRHKHTSACM